MHVITQWVKHEILINELHLMCKKCSNCDQQQL